MMMGDFSEIFDKIINFPVMHIYTENLQVYIIQGLVIALLLLYRLQWFFFRWRYVDIDKIVSCIHCESDINYNDEEKEMVDG